jgi:hypothetical protein
MPRFGKVDPGLRNHIFFLQQADLREHRSGMAGKGSRAGAVRRHADQAACGICPVRVDSAATVHNIRDRQSHADHRTQTRIGFPLWD